MQILVLSDIHANWYALEAVLEDAKDQYQDIVCCGDLVGYNPQPSEVLAWTREHCQTVIRGNHDKVIAGIDDLEWFNDVARAAAVWTMEHLTPGELDYLRELPQGPIQRDGFYLWHGAPDDEDQYVTSASEAAECFPFFELPIAFFGHTHVQGGFFSKGKRVGVIPPVKADESGYVFEMEPDFYYLVNPGSVGQPRDADPRAAYAIYDTEAKTVKLRRVAYPIEKVAADIRSSGLPDRLAARLFHGR